MTRYLDVQASGILDWLNHPLQSPAQTVYAALLRQRRSPPVAPAHMAAQLGLTEAALARALFELNRAASIQVCTEVRDHEADFNYDHALLSADLRDVAAHGVPQLLLAGEDGLCLAQHGLSEEVCVEQAAACSRGPSRQFAHVLPIYLGLRPLSLCSITPLRGAPPALLRLVRRLIAVPYEEADTDSALIRSWP